MKSRRAGKLQSKQFCGCLEGGRWTDWFSQLHQSASVKRPQGTNGPSQNTSANWTVQRGGGSSEPLSTSPDRIETMHLLCHCVVCLTTSY